MAIVDERGRVFGRWNLLDVALLVLLVGLIPLGYAAFLLFRDQPPKLVSIEPKQLQQTDGFTVHIKGENFRPYMRLSIGAQQGREWQFKSTEEADVQFPSVPPGTYDVILFDQAQERFRLPQALTISPSNLPSTEIVAIGAFGNLDAAGAAKLVPGTRIDVGQIIAVGKAVPDITDVFSGSKIVGVPLGNALRLPAVVKFNCYVRNQSGTPFCSINDVTIAPKNLLMVQTPIGATAFQIQRVRGPQPLQDVRVTLRIAGNPSLLSRIKPGDVDTGGIDSDVEPLARVINVVNAGGNIDVTVTARAQRVNDAWVYDSAPLRVGSMMALRTRDYEASGLVTDISAPRQ